MSEITENTQITDLVAELDWRGFIKDCTDLEGLKDHLADPKSAPRKIYCGFDPTADSLTIGNLVPIMMLAHVKRAGHTPVVVMGGGTGLIGDPSGKSAERMMMTAEMVQHHVDCQRPIFENVLGQIDGPEHEIKNNLDWLAGISYIEALRDIGKHFSVNMMMQKESVRDRLNNREQGISYTEFSYMILQAYDFAHLFGEGVTVQFGGSDQYGNIVAGGDLIRRLRATKIFEAQEILFKLAETMKVIPEDKSIPLDLSDLMRSGRAALPPDLDIDGQARQSLAIFDKILSHWNSIREHIDDDLHEVISRRAIDLRIMIEAHAFGLTAPLVQKADGGKFGKTETGAIWLTAARTSPYAYYQFWLNATDEDARNWIKVFTFLDQHTIQDLIARHEQNPGKRELQRTLAQEATTILHGKDAMENAEAAGKALFSGDIASLDRDTLVEVFANAPSIEFDVKDESFGRHCLQGEGVDLIGILNACDLASSNREAREFLSGGSVSVNGRKVTLGDTITEADLLHDRYIAIRRGKKSWCLIEWK